VKGVYSFVDVEEANRELVLKELNNATFRGRKVRAEVTGESEERKSRPQGDRPERSGRPDRSAGGDRYSKRGPSSSSGYRSKSEAGGEGSRADRFRKMGR